MFKYFLSAAFLLIIMAGCGNRNAEHSKQLESLKTYLQGNPEPGAELQEEEFAQRPLSEKEAEAAAVMIHEHLNNILRDTWAAQWDSSALVLNGSELKFNYKMFGEKPAEGWSLYISMHGGGNTTPALNDRQWQNQINLYKPAEGIYMAPRSPTNSWNMWHQEHVDSLFGLFIELANVFEGINLNRVYLTGYSAGGDGTYQLAPRMADRLAAAAMMAGHPNDASPVSLRNLPFALHMGALDSAYNRHRVAAEWGAMLRELQHNDPEGYIHDVQIHEGLGHWMERRDTVAIEWMSQFSRTPYPQKVVWNQNGKAHTRFYWLGLPDVENGYNGNLAVSRQGQVIRIESAENVSRLLIFLNDEMIDLDRNVQVEYNGSVIYDEKPERTIAAIWESLNGRNDMDQVFYSQIEVSL